MDTTPRARSTIAQPAPPTAGGLVAALLPSATFVAASQAVGLAAGIIAATATSAALIIIRRRRNTKTSVVLWASLAYVLLRAAAGILTDSDDVYLGVGLALSAATALAIAASARTTTPAAARLIPAVVRYRDRTLRHPLYRRVAAHVTLAWAAAELAITGWEAAHLSHVTATQFVLVRTLVGWPLMALWICGLIFYIRLRLDPLDQHLARHAAAPVHVHATTTSPTAAEPSA